MIELSRKASSKGGYSSLWIAFPFDMANMAAEKRSSGNNQVILFCLLIFAFYTRFSAAFCLYFSLMWICVPDFIAELGWRDAESV